MAENTNEITALLGRWKQGDSQAIDQLMALVYPELKKIAAAYLRSEKPGHTLQPTALINEAYLRIVDQTSPWASRAHFYGIAAQLMRRILLDHARRKFSSKRGGRVARVGVEFAAEVPEVEKTSDLLEIDRALTQLAALDERQAKVVELRYFGGLSIEETAEALDISVATVKREWTMARAWLKRELVRN
jgi:RNA polymerase sigma-70 factor, ECF subfamily